MERKSVVAEAWYVKTVLLKKSKRSVRYDRVTLKG